MNVPTGWAETFKPKPVGLLKEGYVDTEPSVTTSSTVIPFTITYSSVPEGLLVMPCANREKSVGAPLVWPRSLGRKSST